MADRRVVIASLLKKLRTRPSAATLIRTVFVLALKQLPAWSHKTAPRAGLGGGRAQPAPHQPILVREVCLRIKSKWSNMNNARNIEPDLRLKAAEFNIAMGDWVHSLAPWQVISHLTFAWEASFDSARRCYEKFMRTEMPTIGSAK